MIVYLPHEFNLEFKRIKRRKKKNAKAQRNQSNFSFASYFDRIPRYNINYYQQSLLVTKKTSLNAKTLTP